VRISYGKLRVPVYRITGDDVFACEVDVEVLGANFAPAYTEGDNSAVVATDTMKNFILREALGHDGDTLEGFLAYLGDRLLATYPVMESVRVSGRELRFDRLQGKVFSRSADDHAVATVELDRNGERVTRAGRHGLLLLKTSGSAFTHFARDEYTTLPERGDRPLFVRLDVDWRYSDPDDSVDPLAVREHLTATFDDFVSESIQHLVYEMGARLLTDHPALSEVSFRAENLTRDPVGEQDGRRVYTDPFPAQGLITLTLERTA
jgi:urate oxidase / 2-oxo-4-hydroxy-4-carboxy-5-ureidoimidazoline decarboxylase